MASTLTHHSTGSHRIPQRLQDAPHLLDRHINTKLLSRFPQGSGHYVSVRGVALSPCKAVSDYESGRIRGSTFHFQKQWSSFRACDSPNIPLVPALQRAGAQSEEERRLARNRAEGDQD